MPSAAAAGILPDPRPAGQVVVPDGSPDTIERRLAATRGEASCRVSADTAERLRTNACAR
jgi:hypothetical protein